MNKHTRKHHEQQRTKREKEEGKKVYIKPRKKHILELKLKNARVKGKNRQQQLHEKKKQKTLCAAAVDITVITFSVLPVCSRCCCILSPA